LLHRLVWVAANQWHYGRFLPHNLDPVYMPCKGLPYELLLLTSWTKAVFVQGPKSFSRRLQIDCLPLR
jgi:hypothetical protein